MRFDQATDEEILHAVRASIHEFSTNGAQPLPKPETFRQLSPLLLEFAQKLKAYFYSKRHSYALELEEGVFEARTIEELRRDLICRFGLRKKQCDPVITWLDWNRRVDFFGPLAGHRAGLHKFNDKKILVNRGPTIIPAKQGAWPQLKRILEGMFGPVQLPFVYSWLKISRQALIDENLRPAQSLILCGPKNCGKSLTQECIFTAILGGRVSRPYAWMSGGTAFNSDLVGAEHWMLDDEAAPDDMKVRRSIGAQIKQIASSQTIWSHKKGDEAMPLPLFRRLTISCNEDDDSLNVLPPLNESLEGKIILCRIQPSDFPWPTTDADRQSLTALLLSEYPAFVFFLETFEIPAAIRDQRYGVQGFLDPLVASKVNQSGPKYELLELARNAISKSSKGTVFPYEATAGDIFDLIFNREELRPGLLRVTQFPKGLGRAFSGLIECQTVGISSRLLDGRILYQIAET